jgi:hypothetical protein
MKPHVLYWPSLLVASFGGAVVAAGALYDPVRSLLTQPTSIVAAATTAVLFLRMLLDPKCHQGINSANREMLGGSGFSLRMPRPFDRRWGLFGSQGGSLLLLTIRAGLMAELFAAMFLTGRGNPDLLWLALASAGVAQMLVLLNVGLTEIPSNS